MNLRALSDPKISKGTLLLRYPVSAHSTRPAMMKIV